MCVEDVLTLAEVIGVTETDTRRSGWDGRGDELEGAADERGCEQMRSPADGRGTAILLHPPLQSVGVSV